MAIFNVYIEEVFDRTGLIISIKNFFMIPSGIALEKIKSSCLASFDYEERANELVLATSGFAKLKIQAKYSQDELNKIKEKEQFNRARNWYLSLDDKDKRMVDILLRNNGATA